MSASVAVPTDRYQPSFVDGPVRLFGRLDAESLFQRAAALERRGLETGNPDLIEAADRLLETVLAA